jgi:hypothetical protein
MSVSGRVEAVNFKPDDIARHFTSQEVTPTPAEHLESVPETTAAELAVADVMPIDSGQEEARAVLERVPLWFHTFSLNGAGIYYAGIARDHRYRPRRRRARRPNGLPTMDSAANTCVLFGDATGQPSCVPCSSLTPTGNVPLFDDSSTLACGPVARAFRPSRQTLALDEFGAR